MHGIIGTLLFAEVNARVANSLRIELLGAEEGQ